MAKLPYWGGVDGLLIDDMFTAAWRIQQGLGNSPFRPVRWWMHYAQHPGNFWFWLAHNVSINEDTFDGWSPGLGWYDRERKRERVFINDALWALYLTGYVEIGASVAAATSFTPRTLKKVLKWFVANVGSASDVILFLTSLYYPRHYPVEWDWFGTKLGAVMTMAACIKPVFRGPCGL